MRKRIFVIAILFLFFFSNNFLFSNSSSAITFLNSGRFGDCLLNYIKTKWLSYKNNIKLFYSPFRYSNNLMMSKFESKYNRSINRNFGKTFRLKKNSFAICKDSFFLYITDYYVNQAVDVDFEDENFVKELKKNISPIISIPKHRLPSDRISVAVHVRKGGGFDLLLLSEQSSKLKSDNEYSDIGYPLKFPPDTYYIEYIRKLYNILNKASLHVHIFTDDKNPLRLVDKFSKDLQDLDITFSCREVGNFHDKNVVEDFFAMHQYDCLIRSQSNFAVCSDIVGDFFISIYPERGFWQDGKLIMDEVQVKVNMKNFYKVSGFFNDGHVFDLLL